MRRARLMTMLALALVLLLVACTTGDEANELPAGESGSPSAPGSAASSPLPQYATNEPIRLDEEQILTVAGVSAWTGTDFVQPAPNRTLVAVEVEIEGVNPDGTTVDPFWFRLEDDQLQSYDVATTGKEPQLQPTNGLAPGTSESGWLTFEIPESEGQGLDLIYAPPFTGPVRVDLD